MKRKTSYNNKSPERAGQETTAEWRQVIAKDAILPRLNPTTAVTGTQQQFFLGSNQFNNNYNNINNNNSTNNSVMNNNNYNNINDNNNNSTNNSVMNNNNYNYNNITNNNSTINIATYVWNFINSFTSSDLFWIELMC